MKKIVALALCLIMALSLATVAFAYADDTFDLYLADSGMADQMKLKTGDMDGYTISEVAAKTNSDGSGNVAYLKLTKTGSPDCFGTKTTAPTISSYAVCEDGKTDVLYYVNIDTNAANGDYFKYSMEVKAFSNWGLKCGQVDNVANNIDPAEDYFLYPVNGLVYVAGKAIGTPAAQVLLDGAVVIGAGTGMTVIDHAFVANNFKYDAATKQNLPTSAICTKCLETSTAIYKAGKAPAGSLVKALNANGDTTTWVVVPAAAAGTTAAGVTSAKTFDAGVALYAGMALMSVAGSAVVIGKKKEF